MRPSCPLWSSILNLWITLRISPRGGLGVRLSRRRGIMQTRINRTTEHSRNLHHHRSLHLWTPGRDLAISRTSLHAATSLERRDQHHWLVPSLHDTRVETNGTTHRNPICRPTAIYPSIPGEATTPDKFACAGTAVPARMTCRHLLLHSGTHSHSRLDHPGWMTRPIGRTVA